MMPLPRSIVSLALSLATAAVAHAQAFTSGNLVVIRAGDGNPYDGSARPMSLLEINPVTGAVVTTRALPSTGGGNLLTYPSQNAIGVPKLIPSGDGRYLTVTGHNLAAGSSMAAIDASTSRTIGRIDGAGTINVSTTFTVSAGTSVNGVATSDGSRFYTPVSASGSGLGTTTLGASGPVTTLDTSATFSTPQVVNGQLYMVRGLRTIERTTPALPTTGPVSRTTVVAASAIIARSYVFLDRDASVPGMDTLYIGGDDPNNTGTPNGIQKFSFDGTTWTARGGILGNYISMTARTNGNSVDLFMDTKSLVDGTTEANSLQRFTDTAAYNLNMTTGTPTTLVTVLTGYSLEGLAFAPSAAVPEPGTVGLLAAGALGLARVVRRRVRRAAAAA